MKPVLFEGHDVVLGAPQGWDPETQGECIGLPVMRDKGACISLWELDAEERARIAAGAHLYLQVFSGESQPPVMLHVGRPAEAVTSAPQPLRVRGVGRSAEEPRAIILAMTDVPTDDELRELHDLLRHWRGGA